MFAFWIAIVVFEKISAWIYARVSTLMHRFPGTQYNTNAGANNGILYGRSKLMRQLIMNCYQQVSAIFNQYRRLCSRCGPHKLVVKRHSCFYNHISQRPGPRFNIKMSSYLYRKSHFGVKTILRPSYLRNGISYTGKTTSLYCIRVLAVTSEKSWDVQEEDHFNFVIAFSRFLRTFKYVYALPYKMLKQWKSIVR